MTQLQITGISANDFTTRTKNALEATLGSPIKKDRVVRQFLAHQLHGGTDVGHNEHTIAHFFDDRAKDEQRAAHPHQCQVITLTRYELDFPSVSRSVRGVDTYLCMTDEAVNRKLEELFCANFPDNDGVTNSLMDARLIENYLDDHDDDGSLEEKLRDMPGDEMLDWLLETFSIEVLTSDDGLPDILWLDMIDITVTAEELTY